MKHFSDLTPWCESAGTAIDIAVVPDQHSAVFGLDSNSAFLILTEGDLSDDYAQLYVSPKGSERIECAQVLNILLQRSNDFVYLSPAARLKVQSLESEGWKVHKVHHELLSFYHKMRFAAK